MKKYALILITAMLAVNTTLPAQRGTLVGVQPLVVLTPEAIMQNLQDNMDDQTFALINLLTYKNFSVAAVKIFYQTIDAKGNPTVASGAVFLPIVPSITPRPVFAYLHGTLTKFLDLPSNLGGAESVIGWIMAMDGYISVLPDYLGMGVIPGYAPGIHPYQHAATEASASVDMIKAAGILCQNETVLAKPNGDLYLSGYSQGAHAALATQRELEANPIPGLTLRKTVAGSGAYSLSYIQKQFMFDHPDYPNPSFIPYLLLGYQNVYGNLYTDLDQVFVMPYRNTIPGLFNGLYTVDEIDSQLPVLWQDMLVPKYLNDFKTKYFHPANVAMRLNDLIRWKPRGDLHLYYCNCDELVAKENSQLAYLSFILQGSRNVTLMPLGPFAHAECAPYMLLIAKIRFDLASGTGPAGFSPQETISQLKSGSGNNLSDFIRALNLNETMDLGSIQANSLISAYMEGASSGAGNLLLYPNPAMTDVYIELPAGLSSDTRVLVYDMNGRLVISQPVKESVMKFDVRALPKGLYKVVVPDASTYTGKLVVTR